MHRDDLRAGGQAGGSGRETRGAETRRHHRRRASEGLAMKRNLRWFGVAVAVACMCATPAIARAQATPARPAPAPAPAPAATPAPAPAAVEPQGYTYDPQGRRDPFVSLLRRGGDLSRGGTAIGARPAGLAGLETSEVTLKGTL